MKIYSKKIIIAIISLSLLFCLLLITRTNANDSLYQTSKWYYNHLNDVQKKFYDDVVSNKEKLLDGKGTQFVSVYNNVETESEAEELIAKLTENLAVFLSISKDNPDIFWIDWYSKISFIKDYDSVNKVLNVKLGPFGSDNFYNASYADLTDAEQRVRSDYNAFNNKLDEIAKELLSKFNNNSVEPIYDKAELINNWLIENNIYATDTELGLLSNKRTAFSSIMSKNDAQAGPVCVGYSYGFKAIADKIGVPTIIVDGVVKQQGKNIQHAWNRILVNDGKYYDVDSTWNDSATNSNAVRKNFFLVGKNTDTKLASPYIYKENHIESGTVFGYPMLENEAYVSLRTGKQAQINDKFYDSISEAIKAANDNDVVKLISDNKAISITDTVVVDKNIKLDLNGVTVTINNPLPVFSVKENCKLYISDTSVNENSGVLDYGNLKVGVLGLKDVSVIENNGEVEIIAGRLQRMNGSNQNTLIAPNTNTVGNYSKVLASTAKLATITKAEAGKVTYIINIEDVVSDPTAISVSIDNNNGTIEYYMKENGNYIKLNGQPTAPGEYKLVLNTFSDSYMNLKGEEIIKYFVITGKNDDYKSQAINDVKLAAEERKNAISSGIQTDEEKNIAYGKIDELVLNAVTAINNGTDENSVGMAKVNFINSINAISAENTVKDNAVSNLNNKLYLNNAQREHYKNAIETAETTESVNSIITEFNELEAAMKSLAEKVEEKNSVQGTQNYTQATPEKKQNYDNAVDAGREIGNISSGAYKTKSEVESAISLIESTKAELDGEANVLLNNKTEAKAFVQRIYDALVAKVNRSSATEEEKAQSLEALQKVKEAGDKAIDVLQSLEEIEAKKTEIVNSLRGKEVNVVKPEAIAELEQKADEQKTLIASGKQTAEEKAEAQQRVDEELSKATTAVNEATTNAEVEQAKVAGLNAIGAVQASNSSKETLKLEIDKKTIVKSSEDYTNSDVEKQEAYNTALTKAEEVLAKSDATKEEVDNAKTVLEQAREALNGDENKAIELQTAKDELQAEVDKSDEVKLSKDYINADIEKKEAYNIALIKAEEILVKSDATKEEVNNAKAVLVQARELLNGGKNNDYSTLLPVFTDELPIFSGFDEIKNAAKNKLDEVNLSNLTFEQKNAIKKLINLILNDTINKILNAQKSDNIEKLVSDGIEKLSNIKIENSVLQGIIKDNFRDDDTSEMNSLPKTGIDEKNSIFIILFIVAGLVILLKKKNI